MNGLRRLWVTQAVPLSEGSNVVEGTLYEHAEQTD